MANEYKLSYTAEEIDERLGKVGSAILFEPQTLTEEQKAQVRENIGVSASGSGSVGNNVNKGINLFDKTSETTVGFLESNGIIATNGAYATYVTSDYIELEPGTYTLCYSLANTTESRFPVVVYDLNRNMTGYLYNNEALHEYTFTLEEKVLIRFSAYNYEWVMLISGEEVPENYVEYVAPETGSENATNNTITGNILTGKKWYVCGDSFTEWSTETFNVKDYPNITGKSYYKTYPFFIGVRNNMEVYNSAVSGQTMATPATGGFTNCFSNELYKQIPADTDYITLWFGINDSHHRQGSSGGDGEDNTGVIPLGTINDTTTETFYGAWNVVMEYLLEHHPYAHIGIIVSNGCETTEYPTAEIEIAKKWGVAYLDLNGDYKVPMMHRTNGRSETCERAQELRKNAFWTSVENGNGHPHAKAHEYQSTFIENFLRSL